MQIAMRLKTAAFNHLGQHKDLDDETTPLVHYICQGERESASSLIVEVNLDVSILKFPWPQNYVDKLEQKQGRLVAVKRPTLRKDFEAEREMLHTCNKLGNLHIVTLLASFTHDETGHLVLPLARVDLWTLMLSRSPSSTLFSSSYNVEQWVLSQLIGLTSALSSIHTKLSNDDGKPVFGLHGDVKASNILLFPSRSATGPGILQLADMGSSALFCSRSAASQISSPGYSGTHSSPESVLGIPFSQAIDLWGMGCLILECLVWLTKKPHGLQMFIQQRTQVSYPFGMRFTNDFFFKLEPTEGNSSNERGQHKSRPTVTRLNPGVVSRIAGLRNECSPLLRKMLEILQHDLLQTEHTKRISANALEGKLAQLLNDDFCKLTKAGIPHFN